MAMITVERLLEQRDVDAALYLLSRMLGREPAVLEEKREQLVALKKRLEHSKHLTPEDRRSIIASYREVIG